MNRSFQNKPTPTAHSCHEYVWISLLQPEGRVGGHIRECRPGKTCFHLPPNAVYRHHMAVIPGSCSHQQSNKWQLIVVSHSSPSMLFFFLIPCDVICFIHRNPNEIISRGIMLFLPDLPPHQLCDELMLISIWLMHNR